MFKLVEAREDRKDLLIALPWSRLLRSQGTPQLHPFANSRGVVAQQRA